MTPKCPTCRNRPLTTLPEGMRVTPRHAARLLAANGTHVVLAAPQYVLSETESWRAEDMDTTRRPNTACGVLNVTADAVAAITNNT